jgi:hypothetical protein
MLAENPESVAWLCHDLAYLRQMVRTQGCPERLTAIEEAIRRGEDVEESLYALYRLLGVSEPGSVRSSLPGLRGAGPGRATVDLYMCPAGRCSRFHVSGPGLEPPWCTLYNALLIPQ